MHQEEVDANLKEPTEEEIAKYYEENKELFNGRVKGDIEKYRKGWHKIRVSDSNGNPQKGLKFKVNQNKKYH